MRRRTARVRKRVRVWAVFYGADRSMGYRNGYAYLLDVRGNVVHPVATWPNDALNDLHAPGPMPYDSLEAFLRNWREIESERAN